MNLPKLESVSDAVYKVACFVKQRHAVLPVDHVIQSDDVTACLPGWLRTCVCISHLSMCLKAQAPLLRFVVMKCDAISVKEAPCSYRSRGGPSPCHCRRT